MSNTGI